MTVERLADDATLSQPQISEIDRAIMDRAPHCHWQLIGVHRVIDIAPCQ